MSGQLILLVDDEAHILELCRLYLERDGFQVLAAQDGAAGLALYQDKHPDFLVLDLMLPEVDGFEVCRRIRAQSNVPILMLTARDDDVDKIVGLELGADDYLTKPFNPRELVARIKTILRRSQSQPAADDGEEPRMVGDVRLDPLRREVEVGGKSVDLRTKEFDLLRAFLDHPGIVLTREKLLELVWGYDYYGQTRTVDVHVAHLRKHLAGSANVRLETVTGVGYKLVA